MPHHGAMATVLDVGGPAGASPSESGRPSPGRRAWIAVGVVIALVLAGAFVVLRHRPPTLEQFAAFAQPLDALGAPTPAWTPYGPDSTPYNGFSDGMWAQTGTATWTSTTSGSSWLAVHGWQTTVPVSQAREACYEAVQWLRSSIATLPVVPGGGTEPSDAACASSVARVRSSDGVASDVWAAQGEQTGDGEMRYGVDGNLFYDSASPGRVTVAVQAVASVYLG